jgi:hypothetical protein
MIRFLKALLGALTLGMIATLAMLVVFAILFFTMLSTPLVWFKYAYAQDAIWPKFTGPKAVMKKVKFEAADYESDNH